MIPIAFGYTYIRYKGVPKFVRTRAGLLSASYIIVSTLIYYLSKSIMTSPGGKFIVNKFIEEKIRGKKYWTRNITPNQVINGIGLTAILLSYFLFVWWNAKFVVIPILLQEVTNIFVTQNYL